MNALRVCVLLGGAAIAALGARMAAGCSSYDPNLPTYVSIPNYNYFVAPQGGAVVDMMVARCGTLDCHGALTRPLRIYGRDSLRLDASDNAGQLGSLTTSDEQQADFESVLSLEPEEMSRVVQGIDDPSQLLLLRKATGYAPGATPTGGLVHKGGTVLIVGDDGYSCLYIWLTNKDPNAQQPYCKNALQLN